MLVLNMRVSHKPLHSGLHEMRAEVYRSMCTLESTCPKQELSELEAKELNLTLFISVVWPYLNGKMYRGLSECFFSIYFCSQSLENTSLVPS